MIISNLDLVVEIWCLLTTTFAFTFLVLEIGYTGAGLPDFRKLMDVP